jgi:dynein heavy chain
MSSWPYVCCNLYESPINCVSVQGNPKFLEIVTNWQKKLGTVDVVLNTWLDVQKKWQALESIFVGSADIRVQLPEDSKRFDVVNADFQASR